MTTGLQALAKELASIGPGSSSSNTGGFKYLSRAQHPAAPLAVVNPATPRLPKASGRLPTRPTRPAGHPHFRRPSAIRTEIPTRRPPLEQLFRPRQLIKSSPEKNRPPPLGPRHTARLDLRRPYRLADQGDRGYRQRGPRGHRPATPARQGPLSHPPCPGTREPLVTNAPHHQDIPPPEPLADEEQEGPLTWAPSHLSCSRPHPRPSLPHPSLIQLYQMAPHSCFSWVSARLSLYVGPEIRQNPILAAPLRSGQARPSPKWSS